MYLAFICIEYICRRTGRIFLNCLKLIRADFNFASFYNIVLEYELHSYDLMAVRGISLTGTIVTVSSLIKEISYS